MKQLNWRRGLRRLWLVAAACWFLVAAWQQRSDLSYLYKFQFQHEELLRGAGAACYFREFGNGIAFTPRREAAHAECVKAYSPDAPNWQALLWVVVPPTVGVLFLIIAIKWISVGVAWTIQGFRRE